MDNFEIPTEFFALYRQIYRPLSAEFVALVFQKPQQIMFEECHALAHYSQAEDNELSEKEREENKKKAYSHLLRACLDLCKLIWMHYNQRLDKYFVRHEELVTCFNMNAADAKAQYHQFRAKGRHVRLAELDGVGITTCQSIKMYVELNALASSLLEQYDPDKEVALLKQLRIANWKQLLLNNTIGFFVGVITGVCGNYIWDNLPFIHRNSK